MATVIKFRAKRKSFSVSYMTLNNGLVKKIILANSYKEMVGQLPAACNRIVSTRIDQ